jgi:transposase
MYVQHVTTIAADTLPNAPHILPSAPVVFAAGSCCPGCKLKTALIDLRCSSNYWESRHKDALIREACLKEEVENLQARIRYLTKQLYGSKTEQKFRPEASAPGQSKRNRGHQVGQKGHGRRDYSHLPSREQTISLEPAACTQCGLPFDNFPGTEDSEEIVIDVQAYRRVLHRRRYTPRCTCRGNPGIITAPLSPKLFTRSKIDISVWVHILIEKYHYQRPLTRTLRAMSDFGIALPAGTICDGLGKLAPFFEPISEAIHEKSLQEKWWHADETRWSVVELTEEKQTHRWYVWVFVSSSTVVYVLAPGRDSGVVDEFFKSVQDGILCVDRYSAYKCFVKTRTGFVLAFCWAHVRRDFLEVGQNRPLLESWALQWVTRIGELFHLNKERTQHPLDSAQFLLVDGRLRQALADMEEQRDAELADTTLHVICRKALESLRNHWPGLTVFVDHPHIPMDNSHAEREHRNNAVGRKNYYGSGTINSGHFTMAMFTLIRTLLCWNINPRTWLTEYLNACAQNRGQPLDNVAAFLPWNMQKDTLVRFCSPLPATLNST